MQFTIQNFYFNWTYRYIEPDWKIPHAKHVLTSCSATHCLLTNSITATPLLSELYLATSLTSTDCSSHCPFLVYLHIIGVCFHLAMVVPWSITSSYTGTDLDPLVQYIWLYGPGSLLEGRGDLPDVALLTDPWILICIVIKWKPCFKYNRSCREKII